MSNIFQKIGNQIEKEKIDKKKLENKYWKLSSSERMEYDFKIKEIDERYSPFFPVLFSMIKVMFYLVVFILVVSLFIPNLFITFFTPKTFTIFLLLAELVFIGEGLAWVIGSLWLWKEKAISKLNKRFKL